MLKCYNVSMIIYKPDYYKEFKCIAQRCRHTCCAGWEIDVDQDSLERFKEDPEVYSHIKDGSIVLEEGDRCPFLNEDGLCKLILKYGEDYICDICTEHPRFYNEFEDHIDAGIGLVCEEACRIILDKQDDFVLEPERSLPDEIQIVFDKTKPLSERLCSVCSSAFDSRSRAEILKGYEVLDPVWPQLLGKISEASPSLQEETECIDKNSRKLSNFCAYLMYRYPEVPHFAVHMTYLMADLMLTGSDIYEAARMFSGEIEYSDINIEAALDTFG